ncbi:hypothetical protein Exig_2347 [Exiguobacterium sibiricum 255-15]|uniref:Uncharacterized protein n=1 Tax=Exiguobacterium sibiricum (strain DSM 17290 / CCUG 55495 / CIP 109462 / JCM 13490 / 255-15) TaxID=262543 RepID=B1YKZ5_EXIS2|nr:hypothetical protein Exig_2347 [Exiguobacterium sibiricum 255-15]
MRGQFGLYVERAPSSGTTNEEVRVRAGFSFVVFLTTLFVLPVHRQRLFFVFERFSSSHLAKPNSPCYNAIKVNYFNSYPISRN